MDLCLKHNTDFITNLVRSRTQISVSYASAFLVPSWQVLTLCLYAGLVAWIMLFLISYVKKGNQTYMYIIVK